MSDERRELPTLSFATRAAFARWLHKHHEAAPGLWLRIAKKAAPETPASVTYPEAVEIALCYGWIDGQKKGDGATHWLQKFSPRGKRSLWSKINRDKVVALIEAGEMKPAGLREIERAKQDGRWKAAYDSPRGATVPPDLAAALAESPGAQAFFATLNAANRYAILWRLQTAKKPETRARRLQQFIQMLRDGKKLYP